MKNKAALLLSMLLVLSMLLTGCRPSPVLMQKIYTANATEIDRDLTQMKQDLEGERNEDFQESVEDEDVNPNDVEYNAGQEQSGEEGNGQGKDPTYNANANPNGEAKNEDQKPQPQPPKPEPEEKETPKESEKETEEEDETLDIMEDETDAEEETEESGAEDEDDPGDQDEDPSDEKPKKEVTNGEGEVQEIPEDVQRVTAVGYAAALVEMLGGSGRLMACDSEFAYNDLASTICSDLSSGEVSVWWEGNGSEAIDDFSFSTLLEEKPDVCFEISGQDTFTSAQAKELEKAGISLLALPRLSDSGALVDAAYIIAECLEENQDSGKSAKSIARKYEDWVKKAKSDASGSKKRYSVYISEWRDDIGYSFQNPLNYAALPVDQGGFGYGVAIGWSPKKTELISEFMKAAGVTNESTAHSAMNKTAGLYVAPMFHQFDAIFEDKSYTYYTEKIAPDYDWFLIHEYGGGADPALLGSTAYPGIIVADQNIKSAIENSWYWQYHGIFKLGAVIFKSSYVNETTGDVFKSSIIGEYEIHVNPYGLGDWAAGSVDSPLEAYFVANKIVGSVSDSSLKSAVKSFYQKFFDATLSDAMLEQILAGR